MTFETSFLVLSICNIFFDNSAKSWEDFDNSLKRMTNAKSFDESIDDFMIISNWIDNYFFLLFKRLFAVFFELFLDNLNDIFINSLNDFLFLDDAFEVINLINWNVRSVFEIRTSDTFLFVENDLFFFCVLRRFFNHFA
jgi:hypothetical protein